MSKLRQTARRSLAPLCLVLMLSGCGEAGSTATTGGEQSAQAPAGAKRHARLQVKSQRTAKAAGSADGRPARFFSPASVFNQAPPAEAALDRHSAAIVTALTREVAEEQATRRGPWINTNSYGVPILTVPADQATVPVALDHAPDAALSSAWSAVPLPADAQPAQGSDGYMVVWQPSSDRMWEFWRLRRHDDGWHASWGGAIRHVSDSSGVYGPGAWPGAKPWWGATASSLALVGGAMTIAELREGRIDHALAIALPDVRAGVIAAPAQRTDGSSQDPLALPEGARLRLDPHLDLASLRMAPLTREMAVAAQRYGIVVRDFAANIAFFGQDPTPTGEDPYHGPGGFYADQYPAQLLASFPWAHLQVLKMQLRANP